MKDNQAVLKIFNFSHPLVHTEWLSLLGDKYSSALPFRLEVADSPSKAQVIMWDGIITAKNKTYVEKLLSEKEARSIFLFLGESVTLVESNPEVQLVDRSELQYVEIPGWNALPEEMLNALQDCYQKLKHV